MMSRQEIRRRSRVRRMWDRFFKQRRLVTKFKPRLEPRLEFLEDRRMLAVGDLLHTLFPESSNDQLAEQQGYAVAISADYRIVGAPTADVSGFSDSGVVRVYDANHSLLYTLNNPSPGGSDRWGNSEGGYFGNSVAVSGNYVVVGAYQDDTGASNAGSAYVYDLTSATPATPIATLNNPSPDNPSPAEGDRFGISVAVSGNYAVVGAYQDDTGASNAGSAYVYDLTSATPATPIATMNNPSPVIDDYFGYSVAVSGNYVIVGAYQDDTEAGNAGSAYVYDLTSATPATPIATLNNPSPANFDYFGQSVAVSGNHVVVGASGSTYVYDLTSATPATSIATLDNPYTNFGASVAVSGHYAVVGAHHADVVDGIDEGGAYLYDLTSPTPATPIATLNNPSPWGFARFGYSVAIWGDDYIVGTPGATIPDSEVLDAGSAYVYRRTSTNPGTLIATLNNPSPSSRDGFGSRVAVSGNYAVVAARAQRGALVRDLDERVYVYDLASATATTPIATLKNPSPASGEWIAYSVAVSGKYVLVGGAHAHKIEGARRAFAYVYDLTSATPTTPVASLNTPATYDSFVRSVAVSGHYAVVGAAYDDTGARDAGSVYVYDLTSATPATPIATLNNPSPAAFDFFGSSVAVSGYYSVVGAYGDDTGAIDAGSAYVYDLTSATPATPIAILNNPSPEGGDRFGGSVAVSGHYAVVGAERDDTGASNAGSVYVYDLTSATPATPIGILNHPTPASNNASNNGFGHSVAVSGNYAVVGAYNPFDWPYGSIAPYSTAGSAFVYDLTSATPATPIAILNNPSPASGDQFGSSVAVSGNYIVVGAQGKDTQNYDQGAVYVFEPGLVGPVITPDIVMNSVTANGQSMLTVEYQILNVAVTSPLSLRFLRSTNTLADGADTVLSTVTIDTAADLTVGTHTLNFTIGSQVLLPGAGITEIAFDEFILAVADQDNAIAENDSHSLNEDNTVVFVGAYATSTTIYLHGGAADDTVTLTYPSTTSGDVTVGLSGSHGATYVYVYNATAQFRLRTHGGSDTVNVVNSANITARKMYALGGAGNDVLNGGAGADSLYGGAGNDLLQGGPGNDSVQGGPGNDSVQGGPGNDLVLGALGNDTLDGGAGTNTLVESGNVNFTLTNISLTGVGTDTLANLQVAELTGGSSANTFTVSGWTGSGTIAGGVGSADQIVAVRDTDMTLTNTSLTALGYGTLTLSAIETANLSGGNSANRLNAAGFTLGTVTLQGGNGNDELIGGSGNDVLMGASGNDSLSGGSGRDLLIGGTGRDSLSGETGDDILIGGTCSHGGIFPALRAIMAEWTSANDFATRLANLLNGGGANGTTKLNSTTVQNDSSAADTLTGGADIDWFFQSNADVLIDFDALTGEISTTI